MTETIARVRGYTYQQVAGAIDHSMLKPELTEADVVAGCAVAREYRVGAVCVRPCDVALAASELKGTGIAIGTVIGFPHGSHTTATKLFEATDAIENGATELDMVINLGKLRAGDNGFVLVEIGLIVETAADRAVIKVILENAYLTGAQKIAGCRIAAEGGADFVKTSTGDAPSGATIDDIVLMRANTPPDIGVKAAGGIRTLDALIAALDAGATRVGVSASKAILDDFLARAAHGDGY